MASYGIALLLLNDGNTAHSSLKIPLNCNDTTVFAIKLQSKLAETLRNTELFIWDEAPTLSKNVYETVDRTFRDIMKVDIPFVGKLFIFGGDFRQLLPIV